MIPRRRSALAVLFVLIGGLAIATVAFVSSVVQPSTSLANTGNLVGNPRAQYASAYGSYSLADFTTAAGNGMVVGHDYNHDTTTTPLRDMPQLPVKGAADHEVSPNPSTGIVHKDAPDGSSVQRTLAPNAMPAPILNFDGIPFPGVSCNCHPPDTNGAVGATQYVQIVNEGYQVFDKTNGNSLLGPASINSVWSGFGGACASGSGDPVMLYDKIANRWLISQFASTGGAITDQCIAISLTNDATGTWHRYGFHLGGNFYDYPHLGTWPDAYYQSNNVFNAAGTQFLGPQPFAFDRINMLAGNAATFVSTAAPLGTQINPFLPSDLDGTFLPSPGAPETFVGFPGAGVYDVYHFHVDFITPANSSFTNFAAPAAAPFSAACAGFGRACVPELGVSAANYLDGIGDRLMFRLAYRKFPDGHEAEVGNYTVASNGVTGVRWFELDNTSFGPVTLVQESTYQPDTTWRWMGSIAMDYAGDMALGFSASSATIYPQVRYAGRLVSDPINTLAQGEAHLFDGTGSQTGSGNRWGDYSDMTVDPVDDCTFWYTQEYYTSASSIDWHTRIGNFKYASCNAPTPTPTITPGGPTLTPQPTRTPPPTSTNTPTMAPPTATPCTGGTNAVQNPGFESGQFSPWVTGGNNPTPVVSNAQAHSGTYSALLGATGTPEPLGDGFIYQQVTVPAGNSTLHFWYYPGTLDTIFFDWQDAYVESITGTVLSTIMHRDDNTQVWTPVAFDMSPYAGQTVRIAFLAHEDGGTDPTYMYVDDVSLQSDVACGTPVSTNTPGGATNTPAATNTPMASPTPCGMPAAWVNGMNVPTNRTRALGFYYPANGKFYLVGGRSADTAGTDVLNPTEYDPTTNTWITATATFTSSQVNNMAGGILTVGGTQVIVAVGGSAAGAAVAGSDVRYYNPISDTITTISSDPWPGDSNGTTLPGGYAVANNKLYILGGFNINVSMTSQIWQYDPTLAAGNRWSLKASTLPVALGYLPTTAINNIIYTGGGSTYTGGTLADSTNSYSYNPATDTLTTLVNQIPRATAETRAVSYNGKMWVLGGGRVAPNPSNEVDIYDPVAGTWSVGPPFTNARRNDAADSDGTHIYLAGGYTPTTAGNSLEIYNAAIPCVTSTPTVTDTPMATSTMTSTNTPAATATMTATNTPMASVTPTDCPNPFTDITGNIFYVAIHYLNCRGVVGGLDPTHYGPAGTSTRGQFAKVVVLGFGTPLYTPTTQDFVDVPPSYFAYVFIESGYHAGILSGYDPATCTAHGLGTPCYLPNLPITRAQLTKLVVNAGGYTLITPTGGTQDFSDVPPSNVFYVSIETAYHNGIIAGYPGGIFLPNANIRRDQMAQIVYEGIIHRPGSATVTPVPPTSTPAATSTPGTVSVTLASFAYSPQFITVTVGTTVMWTNTDSFTHTVTADDNSFASGDLGLNGTYMHTFTTAGTVGYHCFYHGSPGHNMYGTINVMAALKPDSSQ